MSSFFFNNSKLQLSNENSFSYTKKECKNDSNKVPSTTENLKTKQESNRSESKKCTDWKFKLTIAVDIIGGLLLVAAVVLKIVQKSSKDDTDVMGIWHIIALVFDCVASISLKVYIVCMNYYLYSTTLKKKSNRSYCYNSVKLNIYNLLCFPRRETCSTTYIIFFSSSLYNCISFRIKLYRKKGKG